MRYLNEFKKFDGNKIIQFFTQWAEFEHFPAHVISGKEKPVSMMG